MHVDAIPTSRLLRSETAGLHRRLEDELRLVGPLTSSRYVRVLVGFRAFLAAWEPRVAAVLDPVLPGLVAARSRSAALARDLALLAPELDVAPAVEVAAIPLARVEEALGSLYVLEGSTLGAQAIGRHLRATLGFTAERGAAWFTGHGDRTGAMWREYRELLDARIAPESPAQRRAIAAAAATFDALRAVFARCGATVG